MITNDSKVGIEYRDVLAPYVRKRLEFSGSVGKKSLSANKKQYTLLLLGVTSPTLKNEAINHLWIKVSKQHWDSINVEDVVRFSGVVSPYKHIGNTEITGVKIAYGQVAYGLKGVKIIDFERNIKMTTVKSFQELSELDSKSFKENNPVLKAKQELKEYITGRPESFAKLSTLLGRNKNYLNQVTYAGSNYSETLIKKVLNDLKKKVTQLDKNVDRSKAKKKENEQVFKNPVSVKQNVASPENSTSDLFVVPKIVTVEELEAKVNKYINDDQFDPKNEAMKQRVWGMNFMLDVAKGNIKF